MADERAKTVLAACWQRYPPVAEPDLSRAISKANKQLDLMGLEIRTVRMPEPDNKFTLYHGIANKVRILLLQYIHIHTYCIISLLTLLLDDSSTTTLYIHIYVLTLLDCR